MSEQEPFKYEPLADNPTTFRLLRLLPRRGLEVRCELYCASMSDSDEFEYEALSYVWGSSEKVELISVNSKEFWITDNLHAALLQLALPDKDRVLWVDGICIDQSNNDEKSQQVRLMGLIFGRASGVIFWLGKLAAEARVLMNCLHRLSLGLPDHRACTLDEAIPLWSDIVHQRPAVVLQAKAGLEYLFERPWFRRVWILQEVANARLAVVCVGFLSVPAHVFALAPHLMSLERPSPSAIDLMSGSSEQRFTWGRIPDLCTLLSKSAASEATDPRDKIYALLGIATDCARKAIVVDYEKTLHQVYHEALQHIVIQEPIQEPSRLEDVLEIAAAAPEIATVAMLLPGHGATGLNSDHITLCDPLQRWKDAGANREVHVVVQAITPDSTLLYNEVSGMIWNQPRGRAPVGLAETAPWDTTTGHVMLLYVDRSRRLESLSWAVRNGYANTLSIMLRLGFIQSEDLSSLPRKGGGSLLEDAICSSGKSEAIVSTLLDIGFDPNDSSGTKVPLVLASKMYDTRVMKILLDHGADITRTHTDHRNGLSYTPLEWALYTGRCDHAELMLRYTMGSGSLRVDAEAHRRGVRKQHNAHCADVFLLMLEYGTNLYETMAMALWVLGATSSDPSLLRPILESAFKRGANANHILHKKTTPALRCHAGKSMLQFAASLHTFEGQHPIPHMELLLELGADVNLISDFDGCDTVLQSAVREGCLPCMSFLLEHGAHVDEEAYDKVQESYHQTAEERKLSTNLLKQYDSRGSRGETLERDALSQATSQPVGMPTSAVEIPAVHEHERDYRLEDWRTKTVAFEDFWDDGATIGRKPGSFAGRTRPSARTYPETHLSRKPPTFGLHPMPFLHSSAQTAPHNLDSSGSDGTVNIGE